MTTTIKTTSASLSLTRKGFKQKSLTSLLRRRSNKSPLKGVKVARSSSSHHRDAQTTTGKSKSNNRRRMMFLGVTTVLLLSAEEKDQAKAFTVGGENLSTGSTFPSSNEKFLDDEDEQPPYTTKDLVLDFVSPIVALRVVNIAFNGGMGGSPKWLDYLCVASVGVVVWVFATDYSGLDAALH